jgi:Flp pilus assembly protein TadD
MRRLALLLTLGAVLCAAGCATVEGARLYHRGTAALDAGDPDLAIRDLEAAAQRVPQASEVQNHLGLAYAAAGRDVEALHAFERAVALDCSNQAAQQNLEAARAVLTRRAQAAP